MQARTHDILFASTAKISQIFRAANYFFEHFLSSLFFFFFSFVPTAVDTFMVFVLLFFHRLPAAVELFFNYFISRARYTKPNQTKKNRKK